MRPHSGRVALGGGECRGGPNVAVWALVCGERRRKPRWVVGGGGWWRGPFLAVGALGGGECRRGARWPS